MPRPKLMPFLLFYLVFSLCSVPATGQPAAPAAPVAADARRTLEVLKDEHRRTELIATLEAIVAAQGGKPAEASPTPPVIPLAPNSLGANFLIGAAGWLDRLGDQINDSVSVAQGLPWLAGWAWEMLSNPDKRALLLGALWRPALAFVGGWMAQWAVLRLLRHPRAALIARSPRPAASATEGETEVSAPPPAEHPAWRRLPFALGCLALDWLGVLAFLLGAHLVIATPAGGSRLMQLVILAPLQGFAAWRAGLAISVALLAPRARPIRLVMIDDDAANYIQRQVGWLLGLVVLGGVLARMGWLLGMSLAAQAVVEHAILLVTHLWLAAIVLRRRGEVAAWLSAPPADADAPTSWLARLAPVWHWGALVGLVALWVLLVAEPAGGPVGGQVQLLGFLLGSLAVLFLARLADAAACRTLARLGTRTDRAPGLYTWLRAAARLIIALLAALALLQVWGLAPLPWLFATTLGRQMLSGAGTIGITVVIAVIVWEGANLAVDRHIARLASGAQAARAVRLRTLLPMLRTALFVGIVILVGLTVLSQLGVNIAPLLAGAGVLGIAIGFGSQKLVQDVITGLFLLLENAIQVGDVVTLGGLTGVVQELTIRSIRLRAEDGSVHVIPFSAVITVTNLTRDFGQAVIEARVANTEDYDKVADMLRAIFADMRAEALWETDIIGDLDMMGLVRMEDTAMVIKCRIKCTPFARWRVLREFQRRMQQQFSTHAIAYPPPGR